MDSEFRPTCERITTNYANQNLKRLRNEYYRYKLVAVINYIGNNLINAMGNYVTFCKRAKGHWECHNDLRKDRQRINPQSKIVMPHLLFYVMDTKLDL
ncbi:hypothetical protein ACI65C_013692 [Semiaphis heraclei]